MATVEIRELIKPETGEKFYPYAHLNGVKGAELLPRIGGSVQTTLPTPIFQIKDALNAQFYPQTHAEAVIGLAQMIESNQFFVKESDGNGGFRIKLKDEFTGFYANGWAAAGGVGTGGGGGGGGLISTVYGESSLGTIYSAGGSESLTATFSAFAIDKVWQSVLALQQSTPNVSLTNGQDYSSITVNGTTSIFYTKSQVDTLIGGFSPNNYLPKAGGTMTGNIEMSGCDIVPAAGTASILGSGLLRFSKLWCVDADLSGALNVGTTATIASHINVGGVVNVNSVSSIDQSHNDMALFNYGARATKSFDAYGLSFNLRACNSSGTQVNILAVVSGNILCGSSIRPNYNLASANLGSAANDGGRWANVYAVNADLTGNITLASTSHIDIGPVRIEYHSSTDSLHITTNDATNHPDIGFWVDGFNSAGGYGSNGGGGGGLITSVYGVSDLGSVYSIGGTEDFTKTFSAFAIDKVWQAVVSLQNTTPNVSLTNGLSYSTITVNGTSASFYTKSQVDSLLGGIHAFDYVTASSLPTAGVDTMYKIYLVPSADPQTLNVKDEYITIRSGSAGSYSYSWEQIGSTAVDLSDYVTTTALGNWTGSTNITTLGTISTGTWSGTAIGVTKGGTGLTAITKGAILYASAANTISALSANGTSTKKFLSQTSSNAPSWGTISLSDISGTSDLQEIEALTGTGLLKRTGSNTWTLDTATYLTSGTTLDSIADGTTRKLANYLPLAGGTMTGNITMRGADIVTYADSTNSIGSSSARFSSGHIRDIYTTFFAIMSDDGQTRRGVIGMGDGYASINLLAASGSSYGSYTFNATYGFFHSGNGDVPCGRSDHRWDNVYTEQADISGDMTLGGDLSTSGDIIPATDLGSQLGYSSRRFSDINVRTVGSVKEINFRSSDNSKATGYMSFQSGYMFIRAGANIASSYKQINLHESYGFYPEQSGVNLGYDGANYRWSTIYGVNADLTGNLVLAATSHIDIGIARIEYDATNKAIHVTTNQTGSSAQSIGFYADGFNSAGGVGSGGGSFSQKVYFNGGLESMGVDIATESSYVRINCSTDRLYIQHGVTENLVLTDHSSSHTVIGQYTDPGTNKLYVNGTARATAWNTTSDARLKDAIDIIDRDDAIDKLMRLMPVTWVWNDRSELQGTVSAGLIAQQVESVIPYMVTDGEYKGLNYTMLHAFEIGAIQSHEDRIKILEGRVKSLNEEIERLRAS